MITTAKTYRLDLVYWKCISEMSDKKHSWGSSSISSYKLDWVLKVCATQDEDTMYIRGFVQYLCKPVFDTISCCHSSATFNPSKLLMHMRLLSRDKSIIIIRFHFKTKYKLGLISWGLLCLSPDCKYIHFHLFTVYQMKHTCHKTIPREMSLRHEWF